MADSGPAQVQRDVSLGSPPPSVTWRCDRSLGGRAGYPHGNHSVRVPDELGHLTSPRGRWLRRTERLLFGSSGRFRSVDDPDPYRSISAIHDDDFKDARQRVSAHSVTTCFCRPSGNGTVHSVRWLRRAREQPRGVLDPGLSFERTSDAPSLRGLPVERLTASSGVGPRIVRAPWSTRISGRTRQPRSFRSSLVKYSNVADPERLSPSHPSLPGPRLALAF